MLLDETEDVFDELRANHDVLRDCEARELDLIARACSAYEVTATAANEAAERLVRGGADGTPDVGDFLALEIAGILGLSEASAALRIAGTLNLKHRHPGLFARAVRGTVRAWQALRVADRCAQAGLSAEAARWVDHQLGVALTGQPWGRAVRQLEGYIVAADPALAAARAQAKRTARGVHVAHESDGAATVLARLDTGDALALDHTIADLATALAAAGSAEPLDQRRATALATLADPGQALTLLSGIDHGRSRRRRATLVVHIAADTIYTDTDGHLHPAPWNTTTTRQHGPCGHGDGAPNDLLPAGVARIEGIGPFDTTTLRRLLAGCHITVHPLVDLNTIPATDHYETPTRLRHAILNRDPVSAAPYATTPSRACDLDHTTPNDPDAPPGARQTRHGNLAPLHRRAHRAKTSRAWTLRQPEPGLLLWTSKLGYRYQVDNHGTRALGRQHIVDRE